MYLLYQLRYYLDIYFDTLIFIFFVPQADSYNLLFDIYRSANVLKLFKKIRYICPFLSLPCIHYYLHLKPIGMAVRLQRIMAWHVRDLKFTVDSKLNFHEHIKEVRINNKCLEFIIRTAANFRNVHAMKLLYYIYVVN